MAGVWQHGRPTLLAVGGAGVRGYTAVHRGQAPVGQEHAAVGGWAAATTHPPRTTPTPAAPPPQRGWLGGLSVKARATRVRKAVREDACLGWAAQLAYDLLCAVFPWVRFVTALLGLLPIPNLLERRSAGRAMVLPGEAVPLPQDTSRQRVTEQHGGLRACGRRAARWSSASAVVALTAALHQA